MPLFWAIVILNFGGVREIGAWGTGVGGVWAGYGFLLYNVEREKVKSLKSALQKKDGG